MTHYELRVASLPTDSDRLGYELLITNVVAGGAQIGSLQLVASRYQHRPLMLDTDDSFWSAVAAWAVESFVRSAIRDGDLDAGQTMSFEIDDYARLTTRPVGSDDPGLSTFLEVGRPITVWEQ